MILYSHMVKPENKQYTIIIFYLVISITFIITWFFPYYERCTTSWGLPCNNWFSFTGFSFVLTNFRSSCGILGISLIISSILLLFLSKIRVAFILITLGNVFIGISMYYLSYLTKQIAIPGLYDVYFLFKIKFGYIILISLMNFLKIFFIIFIPAFRKLS